MGNRSCPRIVRWLRRAESSEGHASRNKLGARQAQKVLWLIGGFSLPAPMFLTGAPCGDVWPERVEDLIVC